MNKALFASLASVALLGASCSVQDFSTVVMEKPTISAVIEPVLAVAPTDSSEISVGSVMSSLWIGDPDGTEYTNGDAWTTVLQLHGVYTDVDLTFVFSPTGHYSWDRLYLLGADIAEANIANYLALSRGSDGVLLFGGTQNINVNTTLYFKEPFKCVEKISKPAFNEDFAIPAHDSYKTGYDFVTYPVMLQGVSSIQWTLLPDQGDVSTGSVNPLSILSLFSSGLLDVQAFRSYCVGSASGKFDFSFVYSSGSEKNILVAPVYVDVTSTSSSDVSSPLIPIVTAVNRASGSALSDIVFTTFFYGAYSGNIIRYVNAESQNQDRPDKVFNRLEVSLPSNQSFVSLNFIGILDGYATGYIDGVAASGADIADLTNRILSLQEDLSQYRGKSYQQIYDAGFQAGLDEENQGAKTFNSLFANILSAPLTILNGVSDISFFGMPILTAILSLLMVAIALFLFKRFK